MSFDNLFSRMGHDGKLLIKIGDHWISEEDMNEVVRRLKEINTGLYTEEDKTKEIENVLKEYNS
jgi:hypothetical protein